MSTRNLCLASLGQYIWKGCVGDYGDLGISPGNLAWTKVEAVTYSGQNWWILRVYDVHGVAYDVATRYLVIATKFIGHTRHRSTATIYLMKIF